MKSTAFALFILFLTGSAHAVGTFNNTRVAADCSLGSGERLRVAYSVATRQLWIPGNALPVELLKINDRYILRWADTQVDLSSRDCEIDRDALKLAHEAAAASVLGANKPGSRPVRRASAP